MIFLHPLHIVLIPVLVSLTAALASAVFFKRRKVILGIVAGYAAAMGGIIVAPSLIAERVVLTPISITQKSGFWFNQEIAGFDFFGVEEIRVVSKPDPDGRPVTIWEIRNRVGGKRDLEPGRIWERFAGDIAARLDRQGIPVIGQDS